jgi:DNA-directed RNA polymerase subunit RPC12/RpoP
MRIIALKCAQCAAPIDLPVDATTRRCEYCNSANLVTAHPAPTGEKAAQLNKVEQELHKLDVEWEAYRRKYLERRDDGSYDIPNPEDVQYQKVGVLAIAGILLLIAVIAGIANDGKGFVFILPIVGVAGFVLLILRSRHKVGIVYACSVENYRQERKRMLASINAG